MVTEVARVPINGLGRARRPRLNVRRVNFVAMLSLAAIVLSSSSPMSGQKRREAILRLRDDVSTVVARTSLTEKQTHKLDRCRATLLLAAQPGRARRAVPKGDLHAALKAIEKTMHSVPFQPEDRNLVQQDINQV